MVGHQLLLLLHITTLTLLLWSMTTTTAVVAVESKAPLAKPNCPTHCGHIEIPFPFGIGAGCYKDGWFQIVCNKSTTQAPKPFLNRMGLEVLEISVQGTLKVPTPITFSNCSNKTSNRQVPNLKGSPFVFSQKNRFTAIGCGVIALMKIDGFTFGGCLSICNNGTQSNIEDISRNDSCSGLTCCQTTIWSDLVSFSTSFDSLFKEEGGDMVCRYAFLVDQDWFGKNTNRKLFATTINGIGTEMVDVPIVLEWKFYESSEPRNSNTHCKRITGYYYYDGVHAFQCVCSKGFQGNPYLVHGCQDINECEDPYHLNRCGSDICINHPGTFTCYKPRPPYQTRPIHPGILVSGSVLGLLFVLTSVWWSLKVIKKRKNIKRKKKFFKQNGGLLLEQQLASGEVNVEKIKLFNSKELEKATDYFNVDRILGQGGQGTVYKGMLSDGRIVAVKKSKIVNGGEVGQFINEIVILSQIIHRNVVKLLGCCLETEVPLLVYEFILNGTLSHYIHHQNEEFPLTWEMRLQVSIEVAGALSYLHSAASFPIYHRDIKSSNILLDETYRAKVADFGTSRSVAIDKTHLTTRVQGTFGYLDPEYFQSSQFTEKSDVYSFGVVLAELLTGQKPVSMTKSQESRSLATYFLVSMDENHLFDILDDGVLKNARKEEIMAVANLTKRCLNLKGKKRPTMKEVAAELEGIQLSSMKDYDVQQSFAEVGYVPTHEITKAWDVGSKSAKSLMVSGPSSRTGSSLDVQPLLFFNTL